MAVLTIIQEKKLIEIKMIFSAFFNTDLGLDIFNSMGLISMIENVI